MEVLCEAPVETPGRAETVTPTLRHWEDGWALHYLTDPAQHCRSRSHRKGPDSVETERKTMMNLTYSRHKVFLEKAEQGPKCTPCPYHLARPLHFAWSHLGVGSPDSC